MRVGANLTVRQDYANVVGSNATVYGNHCTVTGSNASVHGHHNTVTGSNANVIGNDNIVTGSNARVKGDNNRVTGSNATANGSGNIITEPSKDKNRAWSSGAIIQGHNHGIATMHTANGMVMNFFNDDDCVVVNQGIIKDDLVVDNGSMINTGMFMDNRKKKKNKTEDKFVEGPTPAELEHDKETEEGACVVCLTNRAICITHPCRHACACVGCARLLVFGKDTLKKRGEVKCPLCREDVKSILRIHE
jgi:hypothetical protein